MTAYILTISCKDAPGIVAAVTGCLADCHAFIKESALFGDSTTDKFFMRVVFSYAGNIHDITQALPTITSKFNMQYQLVPQQKKCKVLLLVSKHTHCLNHLLYRHATGTLPIDIAGIVSNHEEASTMAKWYGFDYYHLPITPETKAEQESQILELYQSLDIDLVVLARYMQILSPELSQQLAGKAINIHHSFLPGFKGANPYKQAYDRGVKLIGATAHYVTENLDEGPIIEQEVMRVDHTDTPKELQTIGRDIESVVLRKAVEYHAEHRVIINKNKTVVFK
jgi:formyltetrahydrofolate deformylase